jgi:recombination protein RecT
MNQQNSDWFIQQVMAKADEIAQYMPKHLDPQRFMQAACMRIKEEPRFGNCDLSQLLGEIRKAAQDGLIPDGDDAVINMYGNVAKYTVMAAGLLKKIRNSGEIGLVHANVVYNGDEFSHWVDEKGPHLKHIPSLTTKKDDNQITHAYCTLTTKDGFPYVSILSREQIEKRRGCSQQANGIWAKWYREMCIKTVVRDISKVAPMSSDMNNFVRMDDEDIDPDKAPATVPAADAPSAEPPKSRMHGAVDEALNTFTEPAKDVPMASDVPDSIPSGAKAPVAPEHTAPPATPAAPEGMPPRPPLCHLPQGADKSKLSNEVMVLDVKEFSRGTNQNGPWVGRSIKVKGQKEAVFTTFDDLVGLNCIYAKENTVAIRVLWHEGQYQGKPQLQLDYVELMMPIETTPAMNEAPAGPQPGGPI